MALIRRREIVVIAEDVVAIRTPGTDLVLASTFDCKREVMILNLQKKTYEVKACELAKGHHDEHETFLEAEGRKYYWTSTRPHMEDLKGPLPEGESSDLSERDSKSTPA